MRKRLLHLIAFLCMPLMGFSAQPEGFKELQIGDAAPDFSLLGVDGKTYALADFQEPEVLMFYFTGTHCPTSHGIEARLQLLVKELEGESFQVVAINPNNDAGMRPDEYSYSQYTESFEDSKRYAEDLGWTFPFLYDGETQEVAKSYGCLATPHVFIFDKERKLRYTGRFDDSRFPDPATVKQADAQNAIHAILSGEPVPVEKTRPFGCSTKWKEKKSAVEKDDEKWAAQPVTVEEISLEDLTALRKNGSGKLRLFNVWATWCAPCVAEMPDLSSLNRRYSRRPFEIITISLDDPKDKEKAAALLKKHHMGMGDKLKKSVKAERRNTNSYLYAGADTDTDTLAQALDPDWNGALPYSILVDDTGKVLMRESGKLKKDYVIEKVLDVLKTHW